MNRSFLRRVGAAPVFSLAAILAVACFASPATADDPPTDAPRHGSRSKAGDGTTVVWDNVSGAYRVMNRWDTYWIDDRFYQYDNGVWQTAAKLAGRWGLVAQDLVPPVARGRHAAPKTEVTAKLPSGREAVYEPRLKVFRVAGRKGVFLFDAEFYRYDGGVWLVSAGDDGPWAAVSMKVLPVPLRKAVPPPEAGQSVTLPSGETVVYDAESKLFSVQGKPDTLLFDGTFYEKRDNKWFASSKSSAGFEELGVVKVPAPVRMKYRKPLGDKAKSNTPKAKGEHAGGGRAKGEHAGGGKAKGEHAGAARAKPDKEARRKNREANADGARRGKKGAASGSHQGKRANKAPAATTGDEDDAE